MQIASAEQPKTAKKPEKKAEQRARILNALFAVMSSSGAANASVSDIAEAAGIARGALHYYFDSKDELVCALMRRLGEGYLARMAAFVDKAERKLNEGADVDVVAGLVRWHFGGDSDEATRLLGVWIDFWGQAPHRADIGAVVFDVQEQARGLCRRTILLRRPDLVADLTVVDDATLRLHGASLLAIIEGGLLQWRIARSQEGRSQEGRSSATAFDRAVFGDALAVAASSFVSSIPTVGSR